MASEGECESGFQSTVLTKVLSGSQSRSGEVGGAFSVSPQSCIPTTFLA